MGRKGQHHWLRVVIAVLAVVFFILMAALILGWTDQAVQVILEVMTEG
ncbi:MAG: hypothetical protein SV186_01305 [Candidatus Nanohaloarchaea archaeon]|nr:hypothetical protein [Candidatus Nanohaloarchaea archaeon]